MRWVRPLDAAVDDTVETLGAKAYGLAELQRLGLPVPAGFVVTTEACREFLRDGRLPDGLVAELATAIARLETASGRSFGGSSLPLTVSVRSGAAVSMPGMMDTVLNLGLTTEATAALANETGDPRFALRSRLRFVSSFAVAITNGDTDGSITNGPVAGDAEERPATAIDAIQEAVRLRCGQPIPDDASRQLTRAVTAVFASWDAPRARTYRELNDIPHRLGTAAIVQTMVFGNHDAHSGTGVAFSRDPNTGENVPFGDVLIGHQGEDVVDGRSLTRPLRELADREPAVWTGLRDALRRIEGRFRDACYVEFTFQSGELWLLQARPGRFVGAAAVRVATDLADEHVITRHEALLRVSPLQLKHVRTPRIAASDKADVIGTGVGACPGVAVGRVATTTDA
ncbi:MAG: PEP/pyruvate-binding domain-containing protein, partial [Stackebrandtia sp.]